MIRTSFRYWLMTLLLGPACALALEIGEIQVSSALNQLFDARIPLPTLTPEELGKITVKLAGPPMFKEFGLERTSALANLVFAIEYNAEGQVYVRVVSTQPIREPSLALLLEFGWPRGKTFREFTVFLDPVLRLVKRPGGRIKAVMEPPANAVYGPESAAVPVSEPPPVAVAAAPEAVTPPVEWSVPSAPAIAPVLPPAPPPVKTYAPGDRYTVVPDESLWGIALKVRPDPGIAREQMMQALFRANPQAFSKVGITGLKVDVTLRIPTLREIADWTGSPVAKRLAEAGEIKPEPVPDSTTKVVATDEPQTFSLPPAPAPEPAPVAATPEPAPVAATPEPAPIAATPATAPKPETAETTPESEPVTATVEEQSSTQILEPVSATPLLFLAIAEMMAASTQIPVAVPAPAIPPVVASTTLEPNNEPTVITHDPQSAESTESTGQSTEPPPTEPANPVAESPLVGKISEPAVIEIASLVADPPPVIEVVESPGVEVANPAVERLPSAEPTALTAEPTGPLAESPPTASVDSAAPVVYKGGDLYGPVSSNERLWGIATKVRPDPTIGKDTMMRALFMANLQAFSKPGNMNSLKVGAMLRVPTLQEIADLAGSKVARQLLEQSSAVPAEATPAN